MGEGGKGNLMCYCKRKKTGLGDKPKTKTGKSMKAYISMTALFKLREFIYLFNVCLFLRASKHEQGRAESERETEDSKRAPH